MFEKETKDLESTQGLPECSVLFGDNQITFSVRTKEILFQENDDAELKRKGLVDAEALAEVKDKITDVIILEENEERPSVKCKLKHF